MSKGKEKRVRFFEWSLDRKTTESQRRLITYSGAVNYLYGIIDLMYIMGDIKEEERSFIRTAICYILPFD